jgi:hypothetical protein
MVDMLLWQVSWLMGHHCFPCLPGGYPVALREKQLVIYSCGGSSGIQPYSLLAPDTDRQNHSICTLLYMFLLVNVHSRLDHKYKYI